MSRKSITKNYIYNLSYQVLTVLTPFITTPYVSRVLEADGIGTVSYIESIVSYFVIFATMGSATYGQREISYVQDSIEKRSIVFWNTKILNLCTSGIALLAYLLFAIFQDNSIMYLIFAMNIVAVMADITWFFQGMEEFGKIVLRNIVFKIINIAYTFLVVRSSADLPWYAFGHAFFLLLSNASLWWMAPKYLQKVRMKDLCPFKDIRIVLSLFVPTIATQVYTVLDKTMIGVITQNPFENGYYEQALKIARLCLTVITALSAVLIPRIGYYFEKNDHNEVKEIMYKSYRFVWFLGIPLCLGLIMVSGNFIPWFFGPGYGKVADLLCVLAVLILAVGISNLTGVQYLVPTKRQNTLSITVILGACVNLVMNLLLIGPFGAMGAAIASATAEVVITLSQLYFVRKELSAIRILKEGVRYLVAGIIMSVAVYILGVKLSSSIMNTAIMVFFGATVYFAMLFVLKDDFFLSYVKKCLIKIKK